MLNLLIIDFVHRSIYSRRAQLYAKKLYVFVGLKYNKKTTSLSTFNDIFPKISLFLNFVEDYHTN